MKITAENCTLLYVGKLQKAIKKIIRRDHTDPSEDEVFQMTEEELSKFKVNDQTFEYFHTRNNLGGFRWFFKCPRCERRVSKLYLPPNGNGFEPYYYCKECHKLKNQSAVLGQTKFYKNVTKPLMRLRAIESKLDRGYLTQEKVDKLLDEYEGIEKELKSTPEYRLFMFKKKHGLKI